MIYLIPLVLMIIGYSKYDFSKCKTKDFVLWGLLYFVLVLIIGLRYKVGGDTYNYMAYFEYAPELPFWTPIDVSGFEPGFTLFSSLIKTYFDDIYIYQSIISAIMTFFLMRFIKQNTIYKYLAFLLIYVAVYLYFSTEVIRESLAVVAFLQIYPLLEKKKYFLYYPLCLLLLTFHSSAVITLFIPFFRNLKFKKQFRIYLVCTIACGLLLSIIMQKLAAFSIFQKLMRYDQHSYVGYAWVGFRFIYFSILPLFVLNVCKKYRIVCKYENIICLQILFGFGMWFVPIVFQRLINYTIIFYLVSLSCIIGSCLRNRVYLSSLSYIARKNRKVFARVIFIVTLLAHSSYYIHLNFYEIYIPYHSIFDPVTEPLREKYVAGQD